MLRATCDYNYSKDTYIDYVSMRASGRGMGVLLLVVGAMLVAVGFMMFSEGDSTLNSMIGLIVGVLLFIGGIYCVVTGKVINIGTRNGQIAEFLSKHGASDPSGFHEIVRVFDEGVQILYGPVGVPEDKMGHIEKDWGQWRKVKVGKDAVLIVTRTKNDGVLKNIFGFDFLINKLERDGYEDAYMPLSGLSGMSAQELATFVQGKLGK